MKYLLFFFALITLTWNCYGQQSYPTYHFNPKNFPLSVRKYRLYARPQLNNMTKEFYHIMAKFSFYASDLLTNRNIFLKNLYRLPSSLNSCDSSSCNAILHQAYNSIIKINRNLLALNSKITSQVNSFKISENDLIHFASFIRSCFQLEYAIEEQLTKEYLLQDFSNLEQQIETIYHQFNYIIIDTLPAEFKTEFERVWFFFFRPIERYVLPSPTPAEFMKRVENLNMIWNSFHMKISKGEMRMPKNGHKVILTMHARWVSILKLFLKK